MILRRAVLMAAMFLGAAVSLLAQAQPVGGAQSIVGAPALADDGDIWHVPENVALLSYAPGLFEIGAAYSPIDSSGNPVTSSNLQNGTLDAALRASSAAYFMFRQGSIVTNWIGAALRLGRPASVGYAYSWQSGLAGSGQSNLGLIVRPNDFASLGMTLQTGGPSPSVLGLGVAVRPLAFVAERLAPWLTLTADAQDQAGVFEMAAAGAHLSVSQTVGLRGWYDFLTKRVGLEATVALGPSQTHASVASVANPATWSVGESLTNVPSSQPPSPLFGRKIFVVKDLDAIVHGQSPAGFLSRLLGPAHALSFRTLVEEMRQAADDPSVVAVVLDNLPSLGGPASVEEFTDALAQIRKAGKRVYVYASSYPRSFQFQMLASEASWIAVTPTGMVNLSGRSVRRLYLKSFLDRLGLQFVNLAPWKTKSAFNNFSESSMSSEERAQLVRYQGDLQKQALEAFARGRGARLKGTPESVLAAGPFLEAKAALDHGVIDALEYRDGVDALVKEQYPGAALVTSLPKTESQSWGPPVLARRVAVVSLSGNIVRGRGIAGVSIGSDATRLLRKLREDRSIAAVLLRIDSPGGDIVTSDEIAHEVDETVHAGKPVVVSMGDYAASGGYYISAYASRIFAEPGTITGSIGVTGLLPNISGTLEKLGINSSGVQLSPSADLLDPLAPFSARDLSLAHESILADYARFVSTVASGRRMSPERVRQLGKGQVWTGSEALANGLVDSLGGLDAAKAYLEARLGTAVSFRYYWPGESSILGAGLGPSIGAALGESGRAALLAGVLGGTQTAAVAESLAQALAPYARGLAGVLQLEPGPLYYFDWASAGE